MIGGGIFNLPQNMAQSASAGAVGIAWIITGIGMYFLTNTFRVLSTVVPDAKSGIYSYARLGFGKFVGIFNGMGILAFCCICQCRLCNSSYGFIELFLSPNILKEETIFLQ